MPRQRGRVSVAAMLTTPQQPDSPKERVKRPVCPHDLVDEEAEVWASVVNSMPADWFKAETVLLLNQYARHAVQARRIAEWIEKATAIPAQLRIRDYDRLLKMQQRESAAMSSLATKMRLTQQSTTNHRGNGRSPSSLPRPWEG